MSPDGTPIFLVRPWEADARAVVGDDASLTIDVPFASDLAVLTHARGRRRACRRAHARRAVPPIRPRGRGEARAAGRQRLRRHRHRRGAPTGGSSTSRAASGVTRSQASHEWSPRDGSRASDSTAGRRRLAGAACTSTRASLRARRSTCMASRRMTTRTRAGSSARRRRARWTSSRSTTPTSHRCRHCRSCPMPTRSRTNFIAGAWGGRWRGAMIRRAAWRRTRRRSCPLRVDTSGLRSCSRATRDRRRAWARSGPSTPATICSIDSRRSIRATQRWRTFSNATSRCPTASCRRSPTVPSCATPSSTIEACPPRCSRGSRHSSGGSSTTGSRPAPSEPWCASSPGSCASAARCLGCAGCWRSAVRPR